MSISYQLDQLHQRVKANIWLRYFAVFNRVGLAAGFLPSGFVKIMGERFTSLSVNHPMGHYLEALHLTGYYYTFIGVIQVIAAILLLIPRTATLGAVLYFPVILNICILSIAVRFEGSLITSPLMVLANLYLLCWDYDRLKLILPFKHTGAPTGISQQPIIRSTRFPIAFFSGVAAAVVVLVLLLTNGYDIMPRNTLADCQRQCKDNSSARACQVFCNCIHQKGQSLNQALDGYHRALRMKFTQ
ncbi:DoxX family protein [Mucilaginibacter phyllosphaerae]|uniref:DoxX family protein n=1 Tax=Mucilaginibacter phyllosphaerae TaxID=1812349 RepID=A0A4Y8ADJ7_9SPHI|nr:DoxX family protein [Mucilaginibacter phyllosphaerae]MBB3969177.1 putative membrane protein YphA (DoxX/SURF4 family) [Mucilaginibacter phyllosphaerae]TEW66016.1 DoxX family protein [Mucilaginibacter phyllosphaerae]GGH06816.1 hypothetical protein GCM10007352_11200 [Mucilaginibacter phyllosphaerae]